MSTEDQRPDQIEGCPHPRETAHLFGHEGAEAAFLDAFNSGRLHHGWLITGLRGVGKATLAYKIARFLLSQPIRSDDALFGAPPPPDSLDTAPDHPVTRRVLAESEPGLRAVIRTVNDKDRLRANIVVDDIRKLSEFFQLSATDGGRRVVIIDCADEMNPQAANALLKMLEEPPAATTLLLLSHQTAQLLPTIKSRCRTLRLNPLAPDALAHALTAAGSDADPSDPSLRELSGGSVGDALRLVQLSGLEIYAELITLLGSMPNLNRQRALALAEASAQRGAEDRRALLLSLLDIALSRLARQGAIGFPAPEAAPLEAETFARLAPDPWAARLWAEDASDLSERLRRGLAVNLDPAALLLDTLFKLNDIARTISARPAA